MGRSISLRSDRRPLYVQAADKIADLIDSEGLAPDDQLPPESRLAELLGVSRNTVREGLRELQLRGLIARIHGVGTVVQRAPVTRGLSVLESLDTLAERDGWRCGTIDVSITEELASEDLARTLGVEHGASLTRVGRTKTKGSEPICRIESWLPTTVLDRSELEQRFKTSITSLLMERLDYGVTEIRAQGASGDLTAYLNLQPGNPLLVLREVYYQQNERQQPLCLNISYYASDSIRFDLIRWPGRRTVTPLAPLQR